MPNAQCVIPAYNTFSQNKKNNPKNHNDIAENHPTSITTDNKLSLTQRR